MIHSEILGLSAINRSEQMRSELLATARICYHSVRYELNMTARVLTVLRFVVSGGKSRGVLVSRYCAR